VPDLGDPAVEERYADRRELTVEEQRNVARMERWRDLYNGDDMEAFVREAYAPDFRVMNYDGVAWTGNSNHRQNVLTRAETFIRTEEFIKRAAPGRRIRLNRLVPAGNVVTAECSLLDDNRPDWELAWCGVYTFDDEGRIVSDHTYLNHRDWPGIADLLSR
jgi:hypothetical protein